jgi:N-acetylglutamate synthase-like GNAT family acetyltransferase
MEWSSSEYRLTDDPQHADVDAIHRLLRGTYWGAARSRETVAAGVSNSLCFSLFRNGAQVGVARVLSDTVATSYLCDVVVDPSLRGKGAGEWMLGRILEHPAVRETKMVLVTKDAEAFYRKLGFSAHPYACMVRPEVSAT